MGDGLFGMKCEAKEHARLKQPVVKESLTTEPTAMEELLAVAREAADTLDLACFEGTAHTLRQAIRKCEGLVVTR